ncbi:PAZ domain protein [Oesophagostomum dentatum]|uniref:PAZ domain protein n=1 Tax=Oesophagostomum dentatum TaxID=61180 RepID=A0A0B1TJG1_OESDE|nr:PAZ domain protein [Oesophagostomum dentatum]
MHRITGIDYKMNALSTFTLSDGTPTTLRNYFERQYNLKLTTDEQPVLISEGKPKQPGEAPQQTYLLPELVYPTGLTDSMRRDNRQMKELSKYTRLDPEKRRVKIDVLLRKIHANAECVSLLQGWGISLHNELISFKSRELEPEPLYGNRRDGYTGDRAEWARYVKSNGTFRGEALTNWIVVTPYTDDGRYFAEQFIQEIGNTYDVLRIEHRLPMIEYCKNLSGEGYLEAIQTAISRVGKQPVHMMVVLIPDDTKSRYDMTKSFLCTKTNIPSQFVKLSTLRGSNRPGQRCRSKNFLSIVLKIAYQMNCKMGGALWKVKIPMKRGMIVGYDLYHDSTLQGKTMGACVSTMDPEYTKFYSQTQPHDSPTQLGTNLNIFILRAIQKYFKANDNTLPDKIFLYRDGVGDGQIRIVKEEEVGTNCFLRTAAV